MSQQQHSSNPQRFVPANFQVELPYSQLIRRESPEGEDVVPLDVVFVGAGPAGLSGAIELAKLIQQDNEQGGDLGDVQIGVLEKAANLGGHSLSGAVVNPIGFRTLFPQMQDSEFPFRRPVTKEKVYLLTESGSVRLPTPPTMKNHGNYIGSLCEMVRWLGQKAEELGVNVFTSFPVESLLVEDEKVIGVRTTPAGLMRDGQAGPSHMPATDITAQVTVLSEGTRGPLSQAYYNWQNISAEYPQIYALGVKEIWRVKKAPQEIIHTLGWPLKDAFGGSFMYPLADDCLALGLVAGLDYREHNLDVHHSLQRMKQHPLFKALLDGGEIMEWGAKTIPEGGYHAIGQRLHGDGLLILGDAAGLVNVPALKGIHFAMLSGILAARSIFQALKAKDTSKDKLKTYDESLRASSLWKDLYKVRNMRHAFKEGFYKGGAKAALMTLTGGSFPGVKGPQAEDAEEWREVSPEQDKVGLSKVDAVYLSGNKTRDDIPQHLIVGQDVPEEVADFYTHLCPAGVYERQGDKLIVNAPNCIDCKATDVVGPRWQPREGGSGPDYKMM